MIIATAMMGLAFPPAWILTGFILLGGLVVHGSETVKEDLPIESTSGRAAGCLISLALIALLAVLAFGGLFAAAQ